MVPCGTLFSDNARFSGTKLNCETTVSKAAARSGSSVGGAKKVPAFGFGLIEKFMDVPPVPPQQTNTALSNGPSIIIDIYR